MIGTIVMCILSITIHTDFKDTIVTQGTVIKSRGNDLIVNFHDSLKNGGYDMELNQGYGYYFINSNNCSIVKGE